MLRKTNYYNQVSEELMPPKLPKGTVVMYEFIGSGNAENAVSHDGKRILTQLPACVQTPATSTFYDSVKGEFVPIAFIKSVTDKGDITFYQHDLLPKDMGTYVTVTIGNGALADDLYDYYELASFVAMEGKQLPIGARVLYRKVESEKEATRKRDERNKRREASEYAAKLDSIGLQKAALLLGFYSSTTDESIIRDKVEEFAESNPTQFFDRVVNDTHGGAKATVLHGIHLGVLKVQDNAVVWADSKAAICTLSSNVDPEIQVANWANESPENLKTFGFIEDAIGKKISKNASAKKK